MYLNKIQDHRGPLDKATRSELFNLAKQHNVTEILSFPGPGLMPKMLMLRYLRGRGISHIDIPSRPLGGNPADNKRFEAAKPDNSFDVGDDLARQFGLAGNAGAIPATSNNGGDKESPASPFSKMPMHEIRTLCKKHGIAVSRSDKKGDLLSKLSKAGG